MARTEAILDGGAKCIKKQAMQYFWHMKSKKRFALCLALAALWQISLFAQTEGDQFFSAWKVHEIRFQFAQPGYWDSLKANYTLDQYMRCNVTVDGVAYPQCGVKFKGNSSYNNPSNKKPFRIDFAEYLDNQEHDGLKKLVLNNAFKDPTLLREKLMLDFLNAHGIAAPRATFTRLYINNRYWGVYSAVEDVNKTFLQDRFGNKGGNLFKGDPKGTLNWKGWGQNLYQTDYELKTNETANDWSDLIRFLNVLNNAPANQFPDSLSHYLNLDSWFSYWAAHNLFVNLDSYIGSGHNYFLYHHTETGKFEWITWDVNEAFGNFQMNIPLANLKVLPFGFIPQPMQQRPMMNRLWPDAKYKQALADHLCSLLADFSNVKMDARIDSLAALIRADVYADTLKFFPNNRFEENLAQDVTGNGAPGVGNIAGLKPFIAARRASLLQQLALYGCAATEVVEHAKPPEIDLAPNPASDEVRVHTGEQPIESLSLFNPDGRLMFQAPVDGSSEMVLDLRSLPPGVFYLLVNTGEAVHLRRLLVVR